MSGKLYIVATPIGNLEDITLRALDILKSVDVIACEDTRVTRKLLDRYEIKTKTISYHQHSSESKVYKVINFLKDGNDVALVSDAGTPSISDPGGELIEKVYSQNIEVIPIPGASALSAALSISGIKTKEFVFYGFLPHKKGRQTKLKAIGSEHKAVVLYESVHRIKKLMAQLLEFAGDREVCVCRELTKKFETIYKGKISAITDKIVEKGEFVIVIEGKDGKK